MNAFVDIIFWHVSRSFLKKKELPIREETARPVQGLSMEDVADEDLVKESCSRLARRSDKSPDSV